MQTQLVSVENITQKMLPEPHPALSVVRSDNAEHAEAGKQPAKPEAIVNNIALAEPVEKAKQKPVSAIELKNFERSFLYLKGFVDYYKRFPSLHENGELYHWMAQQRTKKNSGKLYHGFEEKLNAINFVWNKNDSNWEELYLTTSQLISSGGSLKGKYAKTTSWFRRQVECYHANELNAYRRQKIEQLFQLPPADEAGRAAYYATWNAGYEALVRFRKENQYRFPSPHDADDAVKQLACWYATAQTQYTYKLMEAEWMAKFDALYDEEKKSEAISKSSRVKQEIWLRHFYELKDYVTTHGIPPRRDTCGWGLYHRYRNMLRSYGTMTDTQKAMFDSLKIAQPSLRTKWHEYYSDVCEYIATHHKLPMHSHTDKRLSEWLKQEISRRKHLTAQQREQLEDLGVYFPPVFVRRKAEPKPVPEKLLKQVQQEMWLRRYEQLTAFRKENSRRWPALSKPHEEELAKFVAAQRQAQGGRRDYTLPAEKIALLDAIGFEWTFRGKKDAFLPNGTSEELTLWVQRQVSKGKYITLPQQKVLTKREVPIPAEALLVSPRLYDTSAARNAHRSKLGEQWNIMFAKLAEFRQHNPHRWPSRSRPAEKPLYHWYHRQRSSYNGKRTTLSPERLEKLDGLGFSCGNKDIIQGNDI